MSKSGRPALPGKISLSLTMQAADRDYLERLGCGSASAGLRVMIDQHRGKHGHQRAKYVVVRIYPSGRRVRYGHTGYRTLADAEREAEELRTQGLNVVVSVKFRTAVPH